jgi:hypothetical protein
LGVYEHTGTTPGESQGGEAPKVERRFVGSSAESGSAPEPPRDYEPDRAWDKLLLVVGAIVAVVAVLVVPGLLNRGGENPVAEAAEATNNAPGVQFTFSGRGQGPIAMSISGKGAINGETNRVSVEMTATGTTPAGTEGFSLQEVLDGDALYLNSSLLGAAFGGSKRWLLMRSEALGDLLQGDASGAGMSASPTQQLDALEDASYQVAEVGPERVNGVATTHYRALIDVDKLTEQFRDEVDGEFEELLERSADDISSATVDVWIDDQGLLRRETSMSVMGTLGSFTMTMDFGHYGSRPDIRVPPPSQVYDATPMLEKALDGLSG